MPVLFAEGFISAPGTLGLTFSPDGRTAYFGRFDASEKRWVILQSRFEAGAWMSPAAVDFSRRYHDAGPALSLDGRRLFFWSLRPNEEVAPKHRRLWVVDRHGEGWGTPRDLGVPVNGPNRPTANPSVSASGTVCFAKKGEDGLGADDIYRARPSSAGGYERIENLGAAVNSPHYEFDVHVAPDESFILFSSNRPGGQGRNDIYISTRLGDGWTPARNLGSTINSPDSELAPCVSPGGRHLFFARMGGPNPGIYRINAAAAGIPRRHGRLWTAGFSPRGASVRNPDGELKLAAAR